MKMFIFKKGKDPGGDSRGGPKEQNISFLKLKWWAGGLLTMILLLAGAEPSWATDGVSYGPNDWVDNNTKTPEFNTKGIYFSTDNTPTTAYLTNYLLNPANDHVKIFVAMKKTGGWTDVLCGASLHIVYKNGVDVTLATFACGSNKPSYPSEYKFTPLVYTDDKGQPIYYGAVTDEGTKNDVTGNNFETTSDVTYRRFDYYPSQEVLTNGISEIYVVGTWCYSGTWSGDTSNNSDQEIVKCSRPIGILDISSKYPSGTFTRSAPGKIEFSVENVPTGKPYYAGELGDRYNDYFFYNNGDYDLLRFDPGVTSGTHELKWTFSNRNAVTLSRRIQNIKSMVFNSTFWYSQSDATIPGIEYPTSLECKFNQWTKKVTLNWGMDAANRLTDGRWYIFRKHNDARTLLTPSGLVESNLTHNNNGTLEYVDGSTDLEYGEKYTYEVFFVLKDWFDELNKPTAPVADLSISNDITLVRVFPIKLSSTGTTKSVNLSWNFVHSGVSTTFDVYRKSGTEGFTKLAAVTVGATSDTATYKDETATGACKTYYYYVETSSVLSTTFRSDTITGHLLSNSQVTKLQVSKGTFSNLVRLNWENLQVGTNPTRFIIGRRLLGTTGSFSQINTQEGTASSYSYDDVTAQPGQYYEYAVASYFYCDSDKTYTQSMNLTDDGFCQSTGIISGRISYGTGVAVPDAKVNLLTASDENTKAQFYSMRVDGQYGGVKWNTDTATCKSYFEGAKPFTVEMWVRLDPRVMQTENGTTRSLPMVLDAAYAFSLYFSPDKTDDSKYQLVMRTPNAEGTDIDDTPTKIVVNSDQFYHFSYSTDGKGNWKVRVVDGDSLLTESTSGKHQIKWDVKTPIVSFGSSIPNTQVYTMKGYIDDVRLWTKELTDKEILANYNRILGGTETGLKIYWPFDEGITNQKTAYDYSKTGGVPNGNHGTISLSSTNSSIVPSADQLSLYGLTDQYGNYVIRGIPYSGEGTNYIVKPTKGVHEFSPQQSTRFVSNTSLTHSAVDFTDVSSFKVTGTVYYKDTNYPLKGANFYVDGTICAKGGKLCESDASGNFEISVPIGNHYIQIKKDGHVFSNEGRYPADPNKADVMYTFVQPMSGLMFFDSTLVVVAGRVCGGDAEKAKPLGFGNSTNNIGQVVLSLSPGAKYRMNIKRVVDVTKVGFADNDSNLVVESSSPYVKSTAYRAGGNAEASRHIYITTDPETGEFSALLPPLQYTIDTLMMKTAAGRSHYVQDNFTLAPVGTINASDPLLVKKDSVKMGDGKFHYFEYCAKLLAVCYSDPTFVVKDHNRTDDLFGESRVEYSDALTPRIGVDVIENGQYKYKYPIFQKLNSYTMDISGYEKYSNYDDPQNLITTRVPLADMEVTVTNQMSSDQSVYTISGTDNSGVKRTEGEFAALVDNKFKLDSLGQATYRWMAGFPNIIEPYTCNLTMTYSHNNKDFKWILPNDSVGIKGIVFGTLPSGTNFVTEGPDQIDMVLRDPPGSGSSAYFEKGTVISTNHSYNGAFSTENEFTAVVELGTNITTATGVGLLKIDASKITKENTFGSDVNVTIGGTHSEEKTTTFTNRFSTSGDAGYVGAAGDIFLGNSTNLLFGNARQVALVKSGQSFSVGRQDVITTGIKFNTQFAYTQSYIENTLLPHLKMLRDSTLIVVTPENYNPTNYSDVPIYITKLAKDNAKFGTSNSDTTVWGNDAVEVKDLEGPSYKIIMPKTSVKDTAFVDKVYFYNQQIKKWTAALYNNEKHKVESINKYASKTGTKNYSFDAGSTVESSISYTLQQDTVYEQTVDVIGIVGTKFGAHFNSTGVTCTFTTKTGVKTDFTEGHGYGTSRTVGFTLASSGSNDALSVDVYEPEEKDKQNGPVFYLRAGQTGCPYEGEERTKYFEPDQHVLSVATMKVESPKVVVKDGLNLVSDVPTGSKAAFVLQLGNLSETGDGGNFNLVPLDATNPHGAVLSLATGPLGNAHAFYVPAEGTVTTTLYLAQGSPDILNYDNIGLVLTSACDPTMADTVYVSAHFVPSSSDITLNIENRVMNTNTGTSLPMSIRDFDASYQNLKDIIIQYRGEREVKWNTVKRYVINKTDSAAGDAILPSGGIVYFSVDMSDAATFPDQTYLFRALTETTFGKSFITKSSDVISVIKDMAKPRLLGMANPTDGILSPGDEISVIFNESIKGALLNQATDFYITGVVNGSKIAHDVGLKLENTSTAAASTEADIELANKSFSVDMWVNFNGAGTLFSHGNGSKKFTVGTDAEGHLSVGIEGSTYKSTKTLPQNSWDFLTFNYSYASTGSTLTAMVANDASTVMLFNTQPVVNYTGVGRISLGENIHGAIQELTLWDRARSTLEAQSEMYVTKSPSTPYLIGYWKFDEGEGTRATDHARSRNMTLSVPNWYMNNINKAVTLDGKSYVALNISACSALSTDDYAYEMWFRGNTKAESTLFSVGEKTLSVGFNSSGLLRLISDTTVLTLSTNDYLDNAWHHLALNVLRNGNAIVYVDGTSVRQVAASLIQPLAGSAIILGATRYLSEGLYDYKNYFTGDVDEVRFWRATLSANALRAGRLNRMNGNEAGLVAYYPFEIKTLDEGNQVIVKGSELDAVSDTIKALSNAAMVYTNEAPALKEARTETNVGYGYVTSDNSIVITLNETPATIENCTINFCVQNVRDANDNLSEPIRWSAYVHRNQLLWSTDGISLKQQTLESKQFTATILNQSGSTENWQLSNLPVWLTASESQGTLKPLSSKVVTFTVNSSTPIGKYDETIYLSGNNVIYEPFAVKLEVSGDEPSWSVNPKDFESSMSIIGQLQIAGIPSEDTSDMIAAFIDGECRGVGKPVYYPRYDSYYVIMNVYGNRDTTDVNDNGKTIQYKVYDASTGTIYPSVQGSYSAGFSANQMLGTMANPYVWNALDLIEQDIALARGWNWISLYMNSNDMSVDNLFTAVKSSTSLVKGKTSFSAPGDTAWDGHLFQLYVGDMYKVKMAQPAQLSMTGKVVKAAETQVTVKPRWNWIGLNADYNLSVSDAFADLAPKDGDQVKDQYDFAIYQDYEWVGTLKTLAPGRGFMYFSNADQTRTFHYPSVASTSITLAPERIRRAGAFTPVSDNAFPGNMTMVARLVNGSTPLANTEVGVFASDGCRSSEVSNADGILFLTIAGEGTGDKLTFKVNATGGVVELNQGLVYTDDATFGTLKDPYLIQLDPTAVSDISATGQVHIYPYRVLNDLNIDCRDIALRRISVKDTGGRTLYSRTQGLTDHNVIPMSSYADGIYLIVVETQGNGTIVRRVLK